jgi:hypothetical protein
MDNLQTNPDPPVDKPPFFGLPESFHWCAHWERATEAGARAYGATGAGRLRRAALLNDAGPPDAQRPNYLGDLT